MIDISGHLRNTRRDLGYRDITKPVVVNCCGCQRFMTRDFSRIRSAGRLDYQLIYIQEGKGLFTISGEIREVKAGEMILYRPGEPQIYTYRHQDRPMALWIHFTGSQVEKWLDKFQITSGYVGKNDQIQSIFEEMILELTLKKHNYEEMVLSDFYRLLALMQRVREESKNPDENQAPIDSLILEINQRYAEPWTVPSMAEFCMMSEGYFAHTFKDYTHLAPMQYLTELRISKAMDFLEHTDMTAF